MEGATARRPPFARRLAATAWMAALTVLVACNDPIAAPARPPTCEPADEQAALVAGRLANGATGLSGAQAVPLDPPVGQYAILVAARLDGSAPDRPIGVWALGSWLGGARVMAIDGPARRWSDWGRAVADRSAAGQQRSRIAARPEVLAVRACMG